MAECDNGFGDKVLLVPSVQRSCWVSSPSDLGRCNWAELTKHVPRAFVFNLRSSMQWKMAANCVCKSSSGADQRPW